MTREALSAADLDRLDRLVDPSRRDDPDDGGGLFPLSVLADLVALIRCDLVSYTWHDPYRRLIGGDQDVGDDFPWGAPIEDVQAFFWQHYWTWGCSRPERTGDHRSVVTAGADADRAALATAAEFGRMVGARHEVMVPLWSSGTTSRRMLFLRAGGRPFSARELTLLALLRPHLVDLQRYRATRRAAPVRHLTPRHRELLPLLAAGLTNRQIARHLHVAEGTVRTHLEKLYAALGVTHRMAAVEAAVRLGVISGQ